MYPRKPVTLLKPARPGQHLLAARGRGGEGLVFKGSKVKLVPEAFVRSSSCFVRKDLLFSETTEYHAKCIKLVRRRTMI